MTARPAGNEYLSIVAGRGVFWGPDKSEPLTFHFLQPDQVSIVEGRYAGPELLVFRSSQHPSIARATLEEIIVFTEALAGLLDNRKQEEAIIFDQIKGFAGQRLQQNEQKLPASKLEILGARLGAIATSSREGSTS